MKQQPSDRTDVPGAKGLRFGIVVSAWNREITEALFDAARETLTENGAAPADILRADVPGSFELPLGAQRLYERHRPDAVICLGCIIEGETPHNTFIAQAAANGIMELSLKYGVPFIFGVLTPRNTEQARERAGGKAGNKGREAAIAAILMAGDGR